MESRENDNDLLKKYLQDEEGSSSDREKDGDLINKILSTSKGWEAEPDDLESSLTDFKDRVAGQKETKIIPWNFLIKIAAILVMGIGISFFFMQPDMVTHVTAKGERLEITLPDQSNVFLDAESSLTYNEDHWLENRSLELSGKAFFEVEKGPEFTVRTKNGKVAVLGTSFTVNDRADAYYVECYTGKVSVSSGNDSKIITTGEGVALIKSNLEMSTFNSEVNKEWVSGEMNYERVDVTLVFSEIQRQYDIKLQVAPLGHLYYSGSIDLKQPAQQNLKRICLIMGLQMDNKNGEIAISLDPNL